jgi:hypothetical protein
MVPSQDRSIQLSFSTLYSHKRRSHLWRGLSFCGSVVLPLAFIIWLAHFWGVRHFGLYEDDWFFIPGVMGIGWPDLWKVIQNDLGLGRTLGRPLGMMLIQGLSFLGYKAGGLTAIYELAFLILVMNAVLFYSFLTKLFSDTRVAFCGAVAFALFPADTTQVFLTHALWLQPAITFLLIALLLYLSGWNVASYIAISLSLLTYETPVAVFAMAPLLLRRGRKTEIFRHWLVLLGILGSVAVLRAITADSRVAHAGTRELLTGAANLIVGPLTCLLMYFYRPVQGLFSLNQPEIVVISLSFVGLVLVLAGHFATGTVAIQDSSARKQQHARSSRLLWAGVVMLVAAYPLTFTTVGFSVAGRGTRVHLAAALGGSILFAWLLSRILASRDTPLARWASIAGLASYFTLLVGFGLTVQKDYVLGWQEQQGFWSDLVRLCPDLKDGDVIFVEPTGLRDTRQFLFLRKDVYGVPDTRQIKSLDTLTSVLGQIDVFPKTWSRPPQVYRLPPKWMRDLFVNDQTLRLMSNDNGEWSTPAIWTGGSVVAAHAIFIETKGGHLTRRADLVNPSTGTRVRLKADSVPASHAIHSPVYNYLILPSGQKPTPYLVN